jgi:hypothetical protein
VLGIWDLGFVFFVSGYRLQVAGCRLIKMNIEN